MHITFGERKFSIEKGQTVLDAALFEGIDFPYSCQVGSCSSCKCKLVSGEIRELSDFDYVLTDEELDSGMILACQSTPKTDLEIMLVTE